MFIINVILTLYMWCVCGGISNVLNYYPPKWEQRSPTVFVGLVRKLHVSHMMWRNGISTGASVRYFTFIWRSGYEGLLSLHYLQLLNEGLLSLHYLQLLNEGLLSLHYLQLLNEGLLSLHYLQLLNEGLLSLHYLQLLKTLRVGNHIHLMDTSQCFSHCGEGVGGLWYGHPADVFTGFLTFSVSSLLIHTERKGVEINLSQVSSKSF